MLCKDIKNCLKYWDKVGGRKGHSFTCCWKDRTQFQVQSEARTWFSGMLFWDFLHTYICNNQKLSTFLQVLIPKSWSTFWMAYCTVCLLFRDLSVREVLTFTGGVNMLSSSWNLIGELRRIAACYSEFERRETEMKLLLLWILNQSTTLKHIM